MFIKNYLKFLALIPLFSVFFGQAQIDTEEYLTPKERFEEAGEFYYNENYERAYDEFMKINYNDTAFYSSRMDAISCASAESRYDTVITICRNVLSLRKYNPDRESFMISYGHALNQQEKYTEALNYLSAALEEYPRSYLLLYNKSISLYELENYDESVKALQESIRYNPRYYASHLKLGSICAEAGDYAKAALCLNMAAFANATDDNSTTLVSYLEAIYAGNVEKELDKINYRDDEDFEEIDLMLENKLAENSKYKVKTKLNYNFVKHNHLLFETMEYDEDDNGFWNQNYVRLFKEYFDRGDFANFSYYQCYTIDNSKTQSIVAKNISKITVFTDWGFKYFSKCMNERMVWDGAKHVPNGLLQYGDYGFNEEVAIEDDKKIGPSISYNGNGTLSSIGQYNDEGDVDGVWKFYNEDGILETEATFVDSKLEGKRSSYYLNGSLNQVMDIKDDKIIGSVLSYYSTNQLYGDVPYNDDVKIDGQAEYYFEKGGVSNRMDYKDGELEGSYDAYHPNGELRMEYNTIDGKAHGHYITYHQNGQVASEGEYDDGDPVGKWNYFHDNGSIKVEGEYNNGLRIGIWETFNENGKKSEESDYGETGKKTGFYREYDLDGNLDIEMTYKGDEFVSYKTFDDQGEILSQGEKKRKELEFENYYSNGNPRAIGNYFKGEAVGNWKYYNEYGVLTSELNRNEDGELEGESRWYFDNGQVETIKQYKEGKVDGYFVDYFRNGNIYKHGWLKEGDLVGEWEFYHQDGTLARKQYYLEDELHGEIEYYDEKGRLNEIGLYYYGNYSGVILFDSTETEIDTHRVVDGKANFNITDANGKKRAFTNYLGGKQNGEKTRYYANGQLSSQGNMIDGDSDGEWIWYHRNGEISSKGQYKFGEREGDWTWYFKSGKIIITKKYLKGNIEGLATRYYQNGKKESEKNYRNNERHGESIYYDESGQVQYIRYYKDGYMMGYSYQGADGKAIEMIPFNNQNGIMTAYFANGKQSYHSEYKDGFNHGETVYYHSNGKKAEQRTYEKNQIHGLLTEYHKSGKVKLEAEYLHGDWHGSYAEYYENGKVKSKKHYIMGELYGWTEYFDKYGKSTEKIFYYNGRQLN